MKHVLRRSQSDFGQDTMEHFLDIFGVEMNYITNEMTLIRGHNYPEPQIRNGFDWEFDNSPLEYNTNCVDMGFTQIDNGWMLNCYPERPIHQSKVLLEMIKEF